MSEPTPVTVIVSRYSGDSFEAETYDVYTSFTEVEGFFKVPRVKDLPDKMVEVVDITYIPVNDIKQITSIPREVNHG